MRNSFNSFDFQCTQYSTLSLQHPLAITSGPSTSHMKNLCAIKWTDEKFISSFLCSLRMQEFHCLGAGVQIALIAMVRMSLSSEVLVYHRMNVEFQMNNSGTYILGHSLKSWMNVNAFWTQELSTLYANRVDLKFHKKEFNFWNVHYWNIAMQLLHTWSLWSNSTSSISLAIEIEEKRKKYTKTCNNLCID